MNAPFSTLNTKIQHEVHSRCVVICVYILLNLGNNKVSTFPPRDRTGCTDFVSTFEVHLLLLLLKMIAFYSYSDSLKKF